MRRIIAILGILVLGTAGCKHVGGKCDCGPNPGEATMYAPYTGVQGGAPGAGSAAPGGAAPEVIGAPKPLKN